MVTDAFAASPQAPRSWDSSTYLVMLLILLLLIVLVVFVVRAFARRRRF